MTGPAVFTGVGEQCDTCGRDAPYLVDGRRFSCGRHLTSVIDTMATDGAVLVTTPGARR